jgi:microcystin-dependent protein
MTVQTTTKWALRYYQGTDVPDGASQQANLAADVERSLPQSGTLAARAAVTHRIGLVYFALDAKQAFASDGTNWVEIPWGAPAIPIGGIIDYAGADILGSGYFLLADGQALARVGQYAPLFAVIGTAFGAGDGSTTFNIPDLRGRVSVGPDNMGTAQGSANRLPNSLRVLGQAAGEERHAQTSAENGAHTHGENAGGVFLGAAGSFAINSDTASGGILGVNLASGSLSQQPNTASTGSGTPHNNMQPYDVVNKLIRVK